ncbi:DUF2500 domain-containing protein [Fictibacillus sp. 26RED30]|nr:DUF2500 domain-containing protein [Fictibacillus sp. 26RED30]
MRDNEISGGSNETSASIWYYASFQVESGDPNGVPCMAC